MATACADTYPVRDQRAKTLPDCSFKGAGENDYYFGFAARDIGNSKIAFRMVSKDSCPYQEELVFVDCGSAEILTIDGVMDPVYVAELKAENATALGGDYEIKYIQKPYGPISVTSKSTANGLERTAQKAGLASARDLLDRIAEFKHRDRFDPYCGCKLFYPGSAGAKK